MTRRGWLLFAAMSVIWGLPYLFIEVAVEHLSPAVIVFGRTSLAGVVLVALAARTGAVKPTLAHWKPVLAFATCEMAVPWLLLTNAEDDCRRDSPGSSLRAYRSSAALCAYALGDRAPRWSHRASSGSDRSRRCRAAVGRDLDGAGGIPWWSVIEVLLVCVCYAVGPFIVSRRLGAVPTLGVVALSLAAVSLVIAPLAWSSRPADLPPATTLWAVLGLAVACTGIAFVVFFALIDAVGPAHATLITFVNPAVAVALGAVVLDEDDHHRHGLRLPARDDRMLPRNQAWLDDARTGRRGRRAVARRDER